MGNKCILMALVALLGGKNATEQPELRIEKIIIQFLCSHTPPLIAATATNPPKWDKVHSVAGVLYIPYAEVAEPFSAWHDAMAGRSRIDYYGGMVKTYQLTRRGQYGTSLKVAPVTTESDLNKVTCLQVNGSESNAIEVQSVLPDPKDFQLAGTEQMNGESVDKFTFEETIGQKTNRYTLFVKYRPSPKYPSSRMPIPVRYEMRGFNNVFGSHYDHYYMEYSDYSHEDIPESVFQVETDEPCVGFPGPGTGHYITFNPMKEFVHPRTTHHVDDEFDRFQRKHGREYEHHKEMDKRKTHFTHNLRYIHSVNRARRGYTLAVNHLTDRSEEELKALRGYRPSKPVGGNGGKPFPHTDYNMDELPESLDWRLLGAVTPPKDQSVCGSCWSFGTVGAIEGALFVATKQLMFLSQQALVDCSWGYGNNGCDGGEDFRAYQWMMKHGGIPTEDSYGPYLGQDGYCHVENATLVAPIKDYFNVTSGDANALRVALFKNGPVSVAIDASQKSFSFYSNGVYYDKKCRTDMDGLDHAVLAVGYGTMNGEDYFIVKNSWSSYWGLQGYVLMAARDDNCGILLTPTYVVI